MNQKDILIIKNEIDAIFKELDNLNYQNEIVVHKKLCNWETLHIKILSEKIALLKLLQRLENHIK